MGMILQLGDTVKPIQYHLTLLCNTGFRYVCVTLGYNKAVLRRIDVFKYDIVNIFV